MSYKVFSAAAVASLVASSSMAAGLGATLWEDGLDDNTADVSILATGDASATFIDYSNFTLGSTTHNIAEAPSMVAGSAATSGVLITANTAAGAGNGANILSNASFSGDYRFSFDMYLSVDIPVPIGGTEQGLFGIGQNGTDFSGRTTRPTVANGTYGWLATELGYFSEDAAVNDGGTELADLGNSLDGDTLFNLAFDGNPYKDGFDDFTPANTWTTVDIVSVGGNVRVLFNGVVFFEAATSDVDGSVMAGYEDPFSSISGSPDFQFGIIDNMLVQALVPAPSAAGAGIILAGLAGLRRRRA